MRDEALDRAINEVGGVAALARAIDRHGAEEIGRRVRESWRALQLGVAKGHFGDVRQIGGMIAVECVKEGDASRPNGDLAAKIQTECRDRGLILTTAGAYARDLDEGAGRLIRFLVPADLPEAVL